MDSASLNFLHCSRESHDLNIPTQLNQLKVIQICIQFYKSIKMRLAPPSLLPSPGCYFDLSSYTQIHTAVTSSCTNDTGQRAYNSINTMNKHGALLMERSAGFTLHDKGLISVGCAHTLWSEEQIGLQLPGTV